MHIYEESLKKKKSIVYMYRNKFNSKVYIGRTMQKMKSRACSDGSGYKSCTKFWRAICKYGWENFELTILAENLDYETSVSLEHYYIELFQSNTPEHGYNILNQEPNRGSLPLEVRLKIAESKKHLTPEQHKRISEAHIGQKAWNKGIKTGPLTDAQRAKFSEARKGNTNSVHVPVRNVETGEIFRSCAEAGRSLGCTRNAILAAMKENRPCKGFHFERVCE